MAKSQIPAELGTVRRDYTQAAKSQPEGFLDEFSGAIGLKALVLKFLDNKICTLNFFVMARPSKTAFSDNSQKKYLVCP